MEKGVRGQWKRQGKGGREYLFVCWSVFGICGSI